MSASDEKELSKKAYPLSINSRATELVDGYIKRPGVELLGSPVGGEGAVSSQRLIEIEADNDDEGTVALDGADEAIVGEV